MSEANNNEAICSGPISLQSSGARTPPGGKCSTGARRECEREFAFAAEAQVASPVYRLIMREYDGSDFSALYLDGRFSGCGRPAALDAAWCFWQALRGRADERACIQSAGGAIGSSAFPAGAWKQMLPDR